MTQRDARSRKTIYWPIKKSMFKIENFSLEIDVKKNSLKLENRIG